MGLAFASHDSSSLHKRGFQVSQFVVRDESHLMRRLRVRRITLVRSYTYWLPDGPDNNRVEHMTKTNSLILIGANGCGKSKLGAWMEKQETDKVHRIGAQRNINISPHIQQKSYAEAADLMFYGSTEKFYQPGKNLRWGNGNYTTKLIDDFNDTLAALIALHNDDNEKYVKECRLCEMQGKALPNTRKTPLEKVLGIWNSIFSARELFYGDGRFSARVKETGATYSSSEMSDGERSVLYLAAQVLAIPHDEGRVIIMDEPEVHLNRSLLMPLWSQLETERPDSLFVFITHDVDFVSAHPASDKIWVKGYDGERWDLSPLGGVPSLPEPLLVGLLGSRRPVLFVEGDRSSYDCSIYSAAYPAWQVVPVGGCTQVIENVKAFRKSKQMHSYMVRGIIDRDYRSPKQLKALANEGIYPLRVAEIENLFLVELVLRFIAEQLAPENDPDSIIGQVKDYVINERFHKQLEKHETQALRLRLKNELVGIDLSSLSLDDPANKVKNTVDALNPNKIATEIQREFDGVDSCKDYVRVLALLNDKNVVSTVGHFFGIENKLYVEKAVALLNGEHGGQLIEAMGAYLPEITSDDWL